MSGQKHLVPAILRDTTDWPDLDPSCLGDFREQYEARREAILMYLDDQSFDAIRQRTGKSDDEVRRLLKRCIAPAPDGRIFGFRALAKHIRVQPYTRRAPVLHLRGSGSAGCAGALGQLFDRFPDIREHIDDLMLKRPITGEVHEARIRYVDVHATFIRQLRKTGLTDDDWPLNTSDRGRRSLTEYCKNLSAAHLERWVSSRSGAEAARKRGLGRGFARLIEARRPFTFMQLDFHRVDGASIIVIVDEHGVEHDLVVARWYLGFLVEEFHGPVVGIHMALESTPSANSVLETVESALRPHELTAGDARLRYTPDGKVLINSFFPELAWHGFAALKVDNAWSNYATDVVNNLIEVIGCAINFGPVRAWWIRSLIEHIFGILTARGLKRLPSTYGAGPQDTTRTDPAGQALKFRILLSELFAIIFGCVRDYNIRCTERLMGGSPVQALEAALSHPEADYLPQPLPVDQRKHGHTFWHIEETTIRGNIKENVRPYVRTDRCRYHNDSLSEKYYLIGKKLLLYIDRRDVRNAFGTVVETGEMLGVMKPEARWKHRAYTLQERKLINRSALASGADVLDCEPIEMWRKEKGQELLAKRKTQRGRKRSSKLALAIAKRTWSSGTTPPPAVPAEDPALTPTMKSDLFGLDNIPVMRPDDYGDDNDKS